MVVFVIIDRKKKNIFLSYIYSRLELAFKRFSRLFNSELEKALCANERFHLAHERDLA